MTNCHAFEVGGNLEFVFGHGVPGPCRRILQSEKCVDCVNQNFWFLIDTTDRPKIYFRIFVSNPPHIFLYHKALTKQKTDGHHELFHRSHHLFFAATGKAKEGRLAAKADADAARLVFGGEWDDLMWLVEEEVAAIAERLSSLWLGMKGWPRGGGDGKGPPKWRGNKKS
jgi:hypothetical protein